MNAPVKSTPSFGATTRVLVEAGIPEQAIIPVTPHNAEISGHGSLGPKSLGKAPGRYLARDRAWCGLGENSDRARYVVEGATPQDVRDRASWPTRNAGLLGRYYPAIDSDAESDAAGELVEAALGRAFGDDASYVAERVRGNSPRRLYAFACRDPNDLDAQVQSWSLRYRLADDPEGKFPHGLDIIGHGKQFVATGIHPSGDRYGWCRDYDLCELVEAGELAHADNARMVEFRAVLVERIEAAGGQVQYGAQGGRGGEARDWSRAEPVMPVEAIFRGLERLPNTPANFPARDDLVAVVAKVRAALGCEADAEREAVEAWACEDPVWCPPEYFDKVWVSLDRGVQQGQDALDRFFRERGVYTSARAEFPDDAGELMRELREAHAERRGVEAAIFDRFAGAYVVGEVNLCRNEGTLQLRRRTSPNKSFKGVDWWQYRDSDPDTSILDEIHALRKYQPTDRGFFDFLRDLRRQHPDCFFSGETLDPRFDRGVVVVEEMPQGAPSRKLNLRYQSPVIRHAQRQPEDDIKSAAVLEVLLEFIRRIFGPDFDYEMDTLAYMAQTGKRPGHMLFLVGEPGVGKSTYNYILRSIFDGIGSGMGGQIDGTKLLNDGARRFALARVEGCRILSIKELPDGSSPHTMAQITSSLKQMVDTGSDADHIVIERKGKDIETVQNFMRVVVTSNYEASIQIEQNDRRIFFVRCGITLTNKPDLEYYDRLNEIISDSVRLATFWRYLCRRDVRDYKPAKAPPVSDAKLEAQIAAMTNPWERLSAAALWQFSHSGRELFDLRELSDAMRRLADIEYQSTGGAIDDRGNFGFQAANKSAQAALRYIGAHADKIGHLRDGSGYKISGSTKRLPVIYARKGAKAALFLKPENRQDVLDALERDRERNCLREDHPMQRFSGSTPGSEVW